MAYDGKIKISYFLTRYIIMSKNALSDEVKLVNRVTGKTAMIAANEVDLFLRKHTLYERFQAPSPPRARQAKPKRVQKKEPIRGSTPASQPSRYAHIERDRSCMSITLVSENLPSLHRQRPGQL